MTPLEKIRAMKMPFAELKGVTFTEADKDRVVAEMLVRPDLCTLNHTIHGDAPRGFSEEKTMNGLPANGSIRTLTAREMPLFASICSDSIRAAGATVSTAPPTTALSTPMPRAALPMARW